MKLKTLILFLSIIVLFTASACVQEDLDDTSPAVPTEKNSASEVDDAITPNPTDSSQLQEPWLPDIIIDSSMGGIPTVDDSVKYDYTLENVIFKISVGDAQTTLAEDGSYIYESLSTNTLLYCDSQVFPYGTISCDLKTRTTTDSGIVFGLTPRGGAFWEGSAISYYFFFLSVDGTAYLGKTDNGTWHILKYVKYGFNSVDTYSLKVVYYGSKICCYVNSEFLIGYRDDNPLTGNLFGLRTGDSGVIFSNVQLTSEYLY